MLVGKPVFQRIKVLQTNLKVELESAYHVQPKTRASFIFVTVALSFMSHPGLHSLVKTLAFKSSLAPSQQFQD